MDDAAVSKARDILHRLSADPEVRRVAEERERTQITRRIEDGALFQEGREEGREEATRSERRRTVGTLCRVLGITLGEPRALQLAGMDGDTLLALIATLETTRAWPSGELG